MKSGGAQYAARMKFDLGFGGGRNVAHLAPPASPAERAALPASSIQPRGGIQMSHALVDNHVERLFLAGREISKLPGQFVGERGR